MHVTLESIGHVRGGRAEAAKDHWGGNRCCIELRTDRYSPASLAGLESVSHIEVVFYFHRHADEPEERGARHPRGRRDWPQVGIFAQHGRMRPNRLGVSVCSIVRIEGTRIDVQGLDAVDGTPVMDIKPVWSGYLPRGEVVEPAWAKELMADYW